MNISFNVHPFFYTSLILSIYIFPLLLLYNKVSFTAPFSLLHSISSILIHCEDNQIRNKEHKGAILQFHNLEKSFIFFPLELA